MDGSVITDKAVIVDEELRRQVVLREDASVSSTVEAHSKRLHGFGIQIQFLLLLTFELDLWKWKTWEVVQYLVKPATEKAGRCRFAELDWIRPFTAPATIFASHCWSGLWGDLVAALSSGAKTSRVVWLDVFAVRQWPGNDADLAFRGIVLHTTATIVAVAPIVGT